MHIYIHLYIYIYICLSISINRSCMSEILDLDNAVKINLHVLDKIRLK